MSLDTFAYFYFGIGLIIGFKLVWDEFKEK